MKTSKDLFDIIRKKTNDLNSYDNLMLGKWHEYTFQYQTGLGMKGLNSCLTVWRYDHLVLTITSKQLTVNDDKRVKSLVGEKFHIAELISAIEQDQTIAIGNLWLLWRITLGGYIACKVSRWRSKAG